MRNIRYRLMAFMQGRYGLDAYGKFLFGLYLVLTLVLWVVRFFTASIITLIFSFLLTLLGFYMLFRVMSRNIYKRMAENQKYQSVINKIKTATNLRKSKIRDRKTHVYRKCPSCKAVLRLKRIKGTHRAACPRCGKSFEVKVR